MTETIYNDYFRQSRLVRQSMRDQTGFYIIVEDDPKQASLLKKLLEKHGKNVKLADTLTGAKFTIEELEPDQIICVIIDLNLPDGLGTGLAQWLSESRSDIPFFIHTVDMSAIERIRKNNPHVEITVKGDMRSFLSMLGVG